MATDTDDTPAQIEVNGSPLPDQLWAAVRQIAPPAMAFAIGRHWIADDVSIVLGVAGAVLWPIIAGQIKTRDRAKKLASIGRDARVPDSVVTVKP